MKNRFILLAALPLICTSCGLTSIVTVDTPTTLPYNTGAYSTSVILPRTHVTTTSTTRVVPTSNDISLYLDLQAVAAAFAQSSTIQEFETLINNSSYMLSNLDLNGDGFVDYLRVMETIDGGTHVFLIQAVLGTNVYQDVATVIAEVANVLNPCVQIVGAPYIYGPKYIIQPVFIATPPIFAHLRHVAYRRWVSPWYWNHFPSCYRHPAPIHVGHYHAYVHTFMTNHRYCHEVSYPRDYHYGGYDRATRDMQRNDYGVQHPERSFSVRNANLPATNGVANASSIREIQAANTRTATSRSANSSSRSTATTAAPATSSSRAASSTSGTTATATSRGASSSSRSTATTAAPATSSSRAASSTTATGSSRAASSTSGTTRTTSSSVTNSGTTNTRITTGSTSQSRSTSSRSSVSSTPSRSTTSSSSSTSRSSVSSTPSRTSSTPSRSTTSSSSSTSRSSVSSAPSRTSSTPSRSTASSPSRSSSSPSSASSRSASSTSGSRSAASSRR